jgi:hypothetical protein
MPKRIRKSREKILTQKRIREAPIANESKSAPPDIKVKRGPGRPLGSKNGKNGNGKNGKNGNGKEFIDPYEELPLRQAKKLFHAHQDEIDQEYRLFEQKADEAYKAEVEEAAINGVKLNPSRPKKARKSPRGRPSKYKGEDTCVAAIQGLSVGMDLVEVSAKLGVMYETFRVWRKTIPEFSVAIKIGIRLSEQWWKRMGRYAIGQPSRNFNATVWIMNMTNRFDWVRKDERTETVKGEKIVTHNHKHVVEEIAKRSSEHTAEVVRILVESGVLSAEVERPAGSSVH